MENKVSLPKEMTTLQFFVGMLLAGNSINDYQNSFTGVRDGDFIDWIMATAEDMAKACENDKLPENCERWMCMYYNEKENEHCGAGVDDYMLKVNCPYAECRKYPEKPQNLSKKNAQE